MKILQEKLKHVFDRFYQVDESTSRDYEGTGIGLALAKEIVELHNGEISVMSIEGKETTFTICIPTGRANYKPEQVIEEFPVLQSINEPTQKVFLPEENDFQYTQDSNRN